MENKEKNKINPLMVVSFIIMLGAYIWLLIDVIISCIKNPSFLVIAFSTFLIVGITIAIIGIIKTSLKGKDI